MDSACPHTVASEAKTERSRDTSAAGGSRRAAWVRAGVVVALLLGLAAAWKWTPLSELVTPERLREWLGPHRTAWYAPVVTVTAYVVLAQLMVPIIALILATGLVFGPWLGAIYAVAGAMASAVVSFGLGRRLGAETLRKVAGGRVDRIDKKLGRHGILAAFLIRKLPVAPYALVNMVVGSSRIRFRDFMVGTFLGIAPGAILLAAFGGQLTEVLRDPGPGTIAVAAGILVLLVGIAILLQRLLGRPGEEES